MKGREPIPGVRGDGGGGREGGGGRRSGSSGRWRKATENATENATGVKAGAPRLDAKSLRTPFVMM